jgi:hypothetical protein
MLVGYQPLLRLHSVTPTVWSVPYDPAAQGLFISLNPLECFPGHRTPERGPILDSKWLER